MFTRDATRSIQQTVREFSRFPKERDLDGPRNSPAGYLPMVVTAAEDIEHDDNGTVNWTTGAQLSATLSEDSSVQWDVYNPGLKVWDGATLWIALSRLPRSARVEWVILRAWSATRIRCTAPASGGLAAGGSGTCTSVTALDGHFSPTTATVYSWTTNVDVDASAKLLAELVWTGTVSRWEIYSADCT